MKYVKLFEEFDPNKGAVESIKESWMSEIDIVVKESKDKEDFKRKFKQFLIDNKKPDLAKDDKFIDNFAENVSIG